MRYRVVQIEFIISVFLAALIIALFLIYRFTDLESFIRPFWFAILFVILFVFKRQTRLEVRNNGIFLSFAIMGLRSFSKRLVSFSDELTLEIEEYVLKIGDKEGKISFGDFLKPPEGSSIIKTHLMFPPYLIANNFTEFVIEVLRALRGAKIPIEALKHREKFEFNVDSESKII